MLLTCRRGRWCRWCDNIGGGVDHDHQLPRQAMSLTFAEARIDRRGLPRPYDVLLGVEATLRLTMADGQVVYEEQFFPIVELAVALQDWLCDGFAVGSDFSFDSVESDESPSQRAVVDLGGR